MRNVQAGQAMVLGARVCIWLLIFEGGGVGDNEVPGEGEGDKEILDANADGKTEDGREDDVCPWVRFGVDDIGRGTELRGTPHNAHIFAAVGLRPGGLWLPHTSHSQLSNPNPFVSTPSSPDRAVDPDPEAAAEFEELDSHTVTFGLELNRPA